jgi:hypothetical protein
MTDQVFRPAVHPMLTISANTLRGADHIGERLGAAGGGQAQPAAIPGAPMAGGVLPGASTSAARAMASSADDRDGVPR